MSKQRDYERLVEEMRYCTKCDLCDGCDDGNEPHVVCQGNLDAELMFCAEAPGLQETIYHQPLTSSGKSGKVYERCLASLGLSREEVFTTNTVSCRPPNNRDPEPYECLKCRPFLVRQLELVRPKLVVTFGRFAGEALLSGTGFKMTRDRGKIWHSDSFGVDVFPVYHPAFIGCYAPQSKREEFKRDVQTLKRILRNEPPTTGIDDTGELHDTTPAEERADVEDAGGNGPSDD